MADRPRHRAAGVVLGYAADPMGNGIAYMEVRTDGADRGIVPVPFTIPEGGNDPRAMAYAAITVAAGYLRARMFTRLIFLVPDESVVQDLAERREVEPSLGYAYVRAKVKLNALAEARFQVATDADARDLTRRAQAALPGTRTER